MRWTPLQRAVIASEDAYSSSVDVSDPELWTRLLVSKDPRPGLALLQAGGELRETFPEVQAMVGFGGHGQGHKDLWDHTLNVVRQAKNLPVIRWAALFHDVGKVETFSKASGKVSFHQHEFVSARLFRKAMQRTRVLEAPQVDHAVFLIRNLGLAEAYTSEWTDSAVRRLHKDLGLYFDDVLLLARADITTKHAHKRQKHHDRMHELSVRAKEISEADAVVPPLPKGLGTAVMDCFGIPPSKKLGDLLGTLEGQIAEGLLEPHQSQDYYIRHLADHRESYDLGKGPLG